MARFPDDALTPREAKLRLRRAAHRLSPAGWVQRKPGDAMLVSLVSGLLLGTTPRLGRAARQAAAGLLLRLRD